LVADVKAIEMDDTKNNNNMLMEPWNAIFEPGNEFNEDDSSASLDNVLMDLFSQWSSFSQNLVGGNTGSYDTSTVLLYITMNASHAIDDDHHQPLRAAGERPEEQDELDDLTEEEYLELRDNLH
jgi:hypothetical protein